MGEQIGVIGASASGLLTALRLAQAGKTVEVYERAEELDPEPRTLIVTGRLRDYLGELGSSSILNEVRRFELFANGKFATVNLGTPDLIVERSTLIKELAKEAEAADVRITCGRRLREMRTTSGGLALDLNENGHSETAHVGAVIGADGASSAVARTAGWPKQPTVPLVQAVVRLPEDMAPDTSRVWFRPQDTPYFFWLIPESPTHGALGVIGERARPTKKMLDDFLDAKGFRALEYQAARIPRYDRWIPTHKKLGSGDVFLVGDAAGQVKVSTVGGLVTGFRGALGVVEKILHGRTKQLRSLKLELESHRLVRRVMHSFSEEDYCSLIDLLNDRTVSSLQRHTRDEAPSILWKLALSQPKLIPLTFRKLLSARS